MATNIEAVLQKVAGYIEVTQPIIDKHNSDRAIFLKKAHQVTEVLTNKGIVAAVDAEAFISKIAADETGTQLWNLVEKLAEGLSADTLGHAAPAPSARQYDAFEKAYVLDPQ